MPATETPRTIRAGFIPLIDSAILVAAAEQGYAREEGIDLRLVREVSWANIRDKVNLGLFDCAHMLAGMPIASSLGIGHVTVPMVAPFSLGQNGNAITVSNALFAEMGEAEMDPLKTGRALKAAVDRRRKEGRPAPTFGMVFPFSSHNYQLRYWMAAAGIDPDRDVRLVVIPPPAMVESLAEGRVDGFCVGEPWNSLAVEADIGRILLPTSTLWPAWPEKVLGARRDWAETHPDLLDALLRALDAAANWAERPENHGELADLLGSPAYLDADPALIRRILDGRLVTVKGGEEQPVPDFLILRDGQGNRPTPEHALWLYSQMVRWGQVPLGADGMETARACFAPDRTEVGAGSGCALFDGIAFDPEDLPGYIARLPGGGAGDWI